MFFSPLSIAITSLGEERANLSFSYVCSICACWVLSVSSLPLGVWDGLLLVILALSGLFSYLSCVFSPSSITITSLGEKRANLNAFRTFIDLRLFCFVCFLFSLWCVGRAADCNCGTP